MGFLIAVLFVAWFGAMIYCMHTWIEKDDRLYLFAAIGLFTLGVGVMLQSVINEKKSGPCIEYETQMHYNPTAKTMMPARVCVLRGEWQEKTLENS